MPYTDAIASSIFDAAEEARVHVRALRSITERAQLAIIGAGDTSELLISASDHLGRWMSAALDDPTVCDEMKADIQAWFAALEDHRNAQRIAALLPKAYVQIYDAMPIKVRPTKRKRKGQRHAKRKA